MAHKTVVTIIDDLDGTEGGTVETVRFSLDGSDYEIDLSENNRIGLYDALAPYLTHARRVQQPARRTGRAGGGASDAGLVRTWARLNGVAVTERGRISASVREQYLAATKSV